MIKVAITGGIGSGKSTLCRAFEEAGIPVYYSDTQARQLMELNEELKSVITKEFSAMSYTPEGELNREWLASEVFNNAERLEALNALVHPAVVADFERWAMQQTSHPYVIVETAILFESGLDKGVDIKVAVLAPEELRL
ncbi:MAG: dephospho-CoA kinase, partial [Rikenellaceae bacterium]